MGIEDRPSKTPWEKRAAIVQKIASHPGECGSCRAWRRDGRRPTVHFHGCPDGPDGAQLGVMEHRPAWQQRDYVDRGRV